MKAMFLSVLVLFSVLISNVGHAALSSQEIPYYGEEFYRDLATGVSNEELVSRLQTVLRSSHQAVSGTYDQISDNCTSQGCYQHISLGYDRARIFMMGVYYLVKDGNSYAIPDLYCGGYKRSADFTSNPPGPNQIPDGNILNTEHTWPQSRFTGKFNKMMQKSDLHHLYPTDSEMNSIRGNNEFGEVVKDSKNLKCPVSRTGKPAGGGAEVFEPPVSHRGNVARALFYFSVRYGLPIGERQENTLRKWNKEDPVDEEEVRRNDAILKVQGNRNPFVDYPELADKISNF
ncbi:endonuclease I family protein [Bdellovibrio svalbardensis]|uniref:Endonuclease n=1 Tax=Bdellovibrio svalbardensis TaxID=2972972 RepID=A0ABT6DGB6_9BACT|nr:endonuclease [Bdellovibrio svalbardensis]MDG0815875.1 endonuclease [Bdellovibrio svalbardensis]